MRAGVAFDHPQVDHELGDRFGLHGAAVVGMEGELVALDGLMYTSGVDKLFGQFG